MLFAKAALFLLYYRVFSLDHWTKIAIYIGISVTSLFYFASTVAYLVLCIPWRNESWTSTPYEERCYRAEVMGDVQGVFGLASDLYIFVLPHPALYRLHMSSKKKIAVTALFLTGLMSVFRAPNFKYSTEQTVELKSLQLLAEYRAIIASSIGLYYRVPESKGSDLS